MGGLHFRVDGWAWVGVACLRVELSMTCLLSRAGKGSLVGGRLMSRRAARRRVIIFITIELVNSDR